MPASREDGTPSDYTPNFTFPHHDVIHEGNWLEYQARGFRPVAEELDGAQALYGAEYVYTGDAYDREAQRPLRHKPGVSVYVDFNGFALFDEERRRQQGEGSGEPHQSQSTGGPGSS